MASLMKYAATGVCLSILAGITIVAIGNLPGGVDKQNKSKGKPFSINLTKPVAANAMEKNYTQRLDSLGTQLQEYARANGYNGQCVFMIDMRLPSGQNRFFVYDLHRDSILAQGLVAHGYGADDGRLQFSNVPGSNCTSLGRYRIGKSYHGRFGLAYKLHGLDSSNSKAFERFVVLHAHSCVPEQEVAPLPICQSQGCPTVAPAFLQLLKKYIENSKAPILLSINN